MKPKPRKPSVPIRRRQIIHMRTSHRIYRLAWGAICTGRDGVTLSTDPAKVTCEDCNGMQAFIGPIHPKAGSWRGGMGLLRPWKVRPYWELGKRRMINVD